MDILLLGMLMLKKSTVYEMRKMIGRNFTSISSNSLGSIHAALNKLFKGGFVDFREGVDRGVNKKVYEITDAGKRHFLVEIAKPMRNKEKNMELIKLFYMGFTKKEERPGLIDAYIGELNGEIDFLRKLKQTVDAQPPMDEAHLKVLHENGITADLSIDEMRDIAEFQKALLGFSIDKLDFEIRWFDDFKKRLIEEDQDENKGNAAE